MKIVCTILDCKWHRKEIICKIEDTIMEYYLDDGEECPYYAKKKKVKKRRAVK